MLEILQFVFSDFWVWSGSTVMLAIVAGALASVLELIGGRRG